MLNAAIADFNKGESVNSRQYSFGLVSLGKNVLNEGTPYNMTGLVGSANITIIPGKNNMLKITIFNITSLTSGASGKGNRPQGKTLPKVIHEESWQKCSIWKC